MNIKFIIFIICLSIIQAFSREWHYRKYSKRNWKSHFIGDIVSIFIYHLYWFFCQLFRDLNANGISGNIPKEIGNLKKLTAL